MGGRVREPGTRKPERGRKAEGRKSPVAGNRRVTRIHLLSQANSIKFYVTGTPRNSRFRRRRSTSSFNPL